MLDEIITRILEDNHTGRLGKVFKTKNNRYFYDMGTGKIAQINENVYIVLKQILEYGNLDNLNLTDKQISDALLDIKDGVTKENILSAKLLTNMTGEADINLEYYLENKLVSLLLEVTEKCNLRCKYCIYHPEHPEFRLFGHRDMTFDTARKAVDILFENSLETEEELVVGFYGGEPLINIDLIKKVVCYAKELSVKYDKELIFSMTTNGTLMSEEIAVFLLDNEFNIIFSLDGNKKLHDENRVKVDGSGSFDDTFKGIKLYQKIKEDRDKSNMPLVFNMVIDGENVEERYNIIQDFFDSEEWLPNNLQVLTTAVDKGHEEYKYILPQSEEEKKLFLDSRDTEINWNDRNNENREKNLFLSPSIMKGLSRIHNRICMDKPVELYGMNGCCVPGQRRMYVTVDGEIYPCEKTGEAPIMGNVYSGFDMVKIRDKYVNDFKKEAKKYCRNCWAVNLCGLCYTSCFEGNDVHFEYRHIECLKERFYLSNLLSEYCECLEKYPHIIEELKELEFR